MLSVLLRYTDSDYPFGIFKPFFYLSMILPFGLPIMSAFALCLFIEHIHLCVCSVAIRIVHLLENQRYFAVIYHLTVAYDLIFATINIICCYPFSLRKWWQNWHWHYKVVANNRRKSVKLDDWYLRFYCDKSVHWHLTMVTNKCSWN